MRNWSVYMKYDLEEPIDYVLSVVIYSDLAYFGDKKIGLTSGKFCFGYLKGRVVSYINQWGPSKELMPSSFSTFYALAYSTFATIGYM